MKYLLIITFLLGLLPAPALSRCEHHFGESGSEHESKTQILESEMVIHGRRNGRTVSSKGYTEGTAKSFTEYLSPEREKGTKMLKLDDKLWIYSPSSDRTIQLSGHMLRQSVMGSDLSYEDMMEDRKLTEMYNAKVSVGRNHRRAQNVAARS